MPWSARTVRARARSMKILSGAYRPDSGTMTLEGIPYAPRGPREALGAGVAMIYQELALAPHLSVEANIMLGQERTSGWAGPRGASTDGWSPRSSTCWIIPTSGPRRWSGS